MLSFLISVMIYAVILAFVIGVIYWCGRRRQPSTFCSVDVGAIVNRCVDSHSDHLTHTGSSLGSGSGSSSRGSKGSKGSGGSGGSDSGHVVPGPEHDFDIRLGDFNDPEQYRDGISSFPDILPIRKDADRRDAFFETAQYYQKLDEQTTHNFIANRYLLTRKLIDADELDYNENCEWWNTGISRLGEYYE